MDILFFIFYFRIYFLKNIVLFYYVWFPCSISLVLDLCDAHKKLTSFFLIKWKMIIVEGWVPLEGIVRFGSPKPKADNTLHDGTLSLRPNVYKSKVGSIVLQCGTKSWGSHLNPKQTVSSKGAHPSTIVATKNYNC